MLLIAARRLSPRTEPVSVQPTPRHACRGARGGASATQRGGRRVGQQAPSGPEMPGAPVVPHGRPGRQRPCSVRTAAPDEPQRRRGLRTRHRGWQGPGQAPAASSSGNHGGGRQPSRGLCRWHPTPSGRLRRGSPRTSLRCVAWRPVAGPGTPPRASHPGGSRQGERPAPRRAMLPPHTLRQMRLARRQDPSSGERSGCWWRCLAPSSGLAPPAPPGGACRRASVPAAAAAAARRTSPQAVAPEAGPPPRTARLARPRRAGAPRAPHSPLSVR